MASVTQSKRAYPTGNQLVDGILGGVAWDTDTLSYSFPTDNGEYDYEGEPDTLAALTANQIKASQFALDIDNGNPADDGFAVEGFTKLNVDRTKYEDAHLRLANTDTSPFGFTTAWGYYPSTGSKGGDVWFFNDDYSTAEAGNYEWRSTLHEIGHALGLKHGQDEDVYGALPVAYDSSEYSVMTYRSYVGDPLENGYSNEEWGYAQSFMIADIAALQSMYGANFTTNSRDTIYTWRPGSGDTLVDGAVAIDAGGDRIFATIWDGGGTDTYDLSAYSTNLKVNLTPGGYSVFSDDQLADLGDGNTARGNIFNALQFERDPRSLIENARGGSGNDSLTGNAADNELIGNDGADTLIGGDGEDTLSGGNGGDTFEYLHGQGAGAGEYLFGDTGTDRLLVNSKVDATFDFRGFDVQSIEEIEFGANGPDIDKTVIFNAEEFDETNEFAANLLIDGNADTGSTDQIEIYMGAATKLNLSGWSFIHWGEDKDMVAVFGDDSAEVVVGTSQRDYLSGGGGKDKIAGGGEDDVIDGGDKGDKLLGGDGGDRLNGAAGGRPAAGPGRRRRSGRRQGRR